MKHSRNTFGRLVDRVNLVLGLTLQQVASSSRASDHRLQSERPVSLGKLSSLLLPHSPQLQNRDPQLRNRDTGTIATCPKNHLE